MNSTKIQLSANELALVQNAEWLLTKNAIIEKVIVLFGDIAHEVQQTIRRSPAALPAEVLMPSPKISKGEKYQGLPYVILDYPRLFGKENIFAIRTLFWWGHFFSVTLHLRGQYKTDHIAALQKNIALLRQHDFYICVAENEWQHDFAATNYTALSQLDNTAIEKILSGNDFCKLSVRMSLQQWDQSIKTLTDLYQVVVQSITY